MAVTHNHLLGLDPNLEQVITQGQEIHGGGDGVPSLPMQQGFTAFTDEDVVNDKILLRTPSEGHHALSFVRSKTATMEMTLNVLHL